MASSSSTIAKVNFEITNNIQSLPPDDKIFLYDAEEQKKISDQRPWRQDPQYFKRVKISAIALIKMVMHARSGGAHEIMGMMQGKIEAETFVVMDAYPLPVEGTETRVSAQNDANEFLVDYNERSKNVGRLENIVGWYHSHPGYGCWLSGIDVMTQMTNQTYTDPFLAIVIDPNRTISAGRVDIGAFRTYPEGYTLTTPSTGQSEYQSIPLNKIEDFGSHASQYYPLEISHFKSSLDTQILDLLWNKYWVMTLSQSSLVTNRGYITSQLSDLTDKFARCDSSVQQRTSVAAIAPLIAQIKAAKSGDKGKDDGIGSLDSSKDKETPLMKAVKDGTKIAIEQQQGLTSQILKDAIFNYARSDDRVAISLPPVVT